MPSSSDEMKSFRFEIEFKEAIPYKSAKTFGSWIPSKLGGLVFGQRN